MKKATVKYSKGEIGRVGVVEDFLPSPDKLAVPEARSGYRLTDEQVEEVRRRRADQKAPKLTLDEFEEQLAIKNPDEKG